MITTCPSALKSLLNKADLLGARTDYRIDQQQLRNGTITFSIDFINYYFGNNSLLIPLIISNSKINSILKKEKKNFPNYTLNTIF